MIKLKDAEEVVKIRSASSTRASIRYLFAKRPAILLMIALILFNFPPYQNQHAEGVAPSSQKSAPLTGTIFNYSRQWGNFGGPSGPNGIALDPSGNFLYIADAQNFAIGKMARNGTLVAIWGSYGIGAGQFRGTVGIATDSSADVFVTDPLNNNVQKFSSSGLLLASWNSNGTTNGMFAHPEGIAVNGTGYVYVVDQGNRRVGIFRNDGTFAKYFRLGPGGNFTTAMGIAIDVQGSVYVDDPTTRAQDTFAGNVTKFTQNGAFVVTWGAGSILSPQGLAVDSSSNVYVADNQLETIVKFDPNQRVLTTIGSMGTLPGHFSNPLAVAVDGQSNVFVGDPVNLNVQQFLASTGAYVATLSYPRLGHFSTPSGSALDHSGNIYIVDQENNRIQKFNTFTDALVTAWGTTGNLTGQFDGPTDVGVDSNGNVYVTDWNNIRVQEFSATGTFIRAWGTLYNPAGITVDQANNVYVTEYNPNADLNRVQKFDSLGNFLLAWGSNGSSSGAFFNPQGIATDSSGMVYVVDSGNNRIEKFSSTGGFVATWGKQGIQAGNFSSPHGIGVDSAGSIYVTDTYNNRIEMFAGNGTYLTSFGPGSGSGVLVNPLGIVVDLTDTLYVTDSNLLVPGTPHNRVEVFAPIHDTGVTSLVLSRNTAYSGVPLSQPVKLTITAANLGLSGETFWVEAFANSTMIGKQNVTLAAGLSQQVLFSWYPSIAARTSFNITAQVQKMVGDPNPANNSIQAGWFYVRLRGDVNGDCKVNISDFSIVGGAFGSRLGDLRYNPNADFNNDGTINIVDFALVGGAFGQTC